MIEEDRPVIDNWITQQDVYHDNSSPAVINWTYAIVIYG